MNLCACERPLPDAADLSCALCGRSSTAAIAVDPLDSELQRRRRLGYRLETELHDRPEDCERDCFKHGGKESCVCEEGDDGTWSPGC